MTRAKYAGLDRKGKAFPQPAQWRRQPNPTSDDDPFAAQAFGGTVNREIQRQP